MSQSPSLSFGPAWMRPKSKQVTQSQPTPISQTYSEDELIEICKLIDINADKSGLKYTDKFHSLEAIQNLVDQVALDREKQQHQQQQQQNYTSSQESAARVNQLNEKVNNIRNNWSHEEQSALDIAGILKNVTLGSTLQNQSPFATNASISTADNNSTQPTPNIQHSSSSIISNQTSATQSAFIFYPPGSMWIYRDPSGNEQGPFTNEQMQDWYDGGYLKDDLVLRKQDDFQYTTIADLKKGQQQQPSFNSFYGYDQFQSPQLTHFATPMTQSSSFSSQLNPQQTQSAQQFQQNQWNSIPRAQSPWVQTRTTSQSSLSMPTTSSQQLFGHHDLERAGSPFMTGLTLQDPTIDLGSRMNSSLTNSGYVSQGIDFSTHDDLFSQINSTVLGQDNLNTTVQSGHEEQDQGVAEASIDDLQNSTEEPLTKAPAVKDASMVPKSSKQELQKDNSVPKTQAKKKQQVKPTPPAAATQAPVVATAVKPGPHTKPDTPKQHKPTPIAPWASATSTANDTKPELTMSQMLAIEKHESAKRPLKFKEDKHAMKNGVPASQILLETNEKKKNDIPLTWATSANGGAGGLSTASTVPVKSIFEIQKEEEEAARKRDEMEMRQAIAIVEANERKATATTNSFADIANNGSWTTVVAKKQQQQAKKDNKTKITSSSSRISPDMLRKVSAPPLPQSVPTSRANAGVSKIKTRYEFLEWCKSTMKLNKNISVDEVLSILLVLPSGMNESKEIIADTIYSNSSTMDGRRFANEFLKRREAVEAIAQGDGLQWDDVLVSFNRGDTVDDNDGDFQVVRKGKRRN